MQNLLFINGNNVELFAWSCHRLNYYSVGSAPICSQSHGACTCRPSRVAASLPESKLSSVTPPTFGQKRNMNCTWMQSTGKLAHETRTFTAWPIAKRFRYRNIHLDEPVYMYLSYLPMHWYLKCICNIFTAWPIVVHSCHGQEEDVNMHKTYIMTACMCSHRTWGPCLH